MEQNKIQFNRNSRLKKFTLFPITPKTIQGALKIKGQTLLPHSTLNSRIRQIISHSMQSQHPERRCS